MDTYVWVIILLGLSVVTLFALNTLRIMRRREHKRAEDDDAARTAVEKIDNAADMVINEINNTARLALDEINEKYQAMVFLYSLLDEKKKEISALTASNTEARPAAGSRKAAVTASNNRPAALPIEKNAHHKRVMALYQEGLSVSEIAKRLGIGRGEVQLMVDLMGRVN